MRVNVDSTTFRRCGRGGFSLIECMVYISVFAVVLGFSTMAFFKCWDQHRAMRRDAEDIVRVLHAGEQWRKDMRTASGRVETVVSNEVEEVRIPGARGVVVYKFAENSVTRSSDDNQQAAEVLTRVARSQMQSDDRLDVNAWRWELELQTKRKGARVKPLFTFEAVTGNK